MRRRTVEIARLAYSLDGHEPDVRKAAAAITLTEMYFRPLPIRMAEYVLAGLLCAVGKEYLHLSVGVSQLSLRHIHQRCENSGLGLIFLTSDPARCMNECCHFIRSLEYGNLSDLADCYNGNSTKHYTRLLGINFDEVTQVFDRLEATHPS